MVPFVPAAQPEARGGRCELVADLELLARRAVFGGKGNETRVQPVKFVLVAGLLSLQAHRTPVPRPNPASAH